MKKAPLHPKLNETPSLQTQKFVTPSIYQQFHKTMTSFFFLFFLLIDLKAAPPHPPSNQKHLPYPTISQNDDVFFSVFCSSIWKPLPRSKIPPSSRHKAAPKMKSPPPSPLETVTTGIQTPSMGSISDIVYRLHHEVRHRTHNRNMLLNEAVCLRISVYKGRKSKYGSSERAGHCLSFGPTFNLQTIFQVEKSQFEISQFWAK